MKVPLTHPDGAAHRKQIANSLSGVNVKNFGAVGDGVADDTIAITAARDYISLSTTTNRLIFGEGIYVYSASPNWAINGARIEFEGEVRLRNTGSGSCVIIDQGTTGTLFDVQFGWNNKPFIEGTSSSNHGIYVRSVHHSKIAGNIRGCGAKGLHVDFSVVNEYDIVCSINEGPWYTSATPTGGIFLTRRDAAEKASANIFYNPIIEGMSATGIEFDWAVQNTVIGGTSEANTGTNFECTANAWYNKILGTDLEATTSGDGIIEAGRWNTWNEVLNDALTTISASAEGCTFRGGQYDAITNAGDITTLESLSYGSNNGEITDTGTNTTIRNAYDLTSASHKQVNITLGKNDFTKTIAVGAFAVPGAVPGIVTKVGIVVAGVAVGDNISLVSQTALAAGFDPSPSAVCVIAGQIDITCVQLNGAAVSPLAAGANFVVTVNG